ncbi:histidine phosphatase family protein [Treponema sp. OMZ 840]|uniref:histidine phosphatase family protein n=1 Tax=Treponema sp. OMZ 840 TaxID=244313 RepID=UPI003D94DD5E
MKLFITRHGETDWNVQKRTCGWSESQLTERGHAQAEALAKRLELMQKQNDIQKIYVSPLKRARDTASYIERALCLKAVPDERIKEVHFGKMENVFWEKAPDFWHIKDNPFMRFPEGESLVQAAHRAYSLIEEVRDLNAGGNVLFVCHGMITILMTTYFKSASQDELYGLRIDNCQLLEFEL